MEDYIQMNQYIDRLETLFRQYLTNFDKNDLHYRRMTELMKIMLARYSMRHRDANLDKDKIEIISKAAYFCDIGMMLVPDKMAVFSRNPEKFDQLTKNHTKYGTYLIKLGENPHCEFFISICSDMCMNHHERFDGFGYPRGIGGKNLSPYSQLCHLADELDTLFSKLYGSNEIQVNLVMKQMLKDQGAVSEELLSLFEDCKQSFIGYYSKKKGD